MFRKKKPTAKQGPIVVPEFQLASETRDALNTAITKADDALMRLSGVDHRLIALELAIKDPDLGIDRMRRLEMEFDRLTAKLAATTGITFQRAGVNWQRKETRDTTTETAPGSMPPTLTGQAGREPAI